MPSAKNVNGKNMSDRKPGEKKPGKQHYNPVNMSGREAGIVEEIEQDRREEDDSSESEKPRAPSRKR